MEAELGKQHGESMCQRCQRNAGHFQRGGHQLFYQSVHHCLILVDAFFVLVFFNFFRPETSNVCKNLPPSALFSTLFQGFPLAHQISFVYMFNDSMKNTL